MSSKSRPTLDTLPDELLYKILDKVPPHHVYNNLSKVNKSMFEILNSNSSPYWCQCMLNDDRLLIPRRDKNELFPVKTSMAAKTVINQYDFVQHRPFRNSPKANCEFMADADTIQKSLKLYSSSSSSYEPSVFIGRRDGVIELVTSHGNQEERFLGRQWIWSIGCRPDRLYATCLSGHVNVFSLSEEGIGQSVFARNLKQTVSVSLCLVEDHQFAIGSNDGTVYLIDERTDHYPCDIIIRPPMGNMNHIKNLRYIGFNQRLVGIYKNTVAEVDLRMNEFVFPQSRNRRSAVHSKLTTLCPSPWNTREYPVAMCGDIDGRIFDVFTSGQSGGVEIVAAVSEGQRVHSPKHYLHWVSAVSWMEGVRVVADNRGRVCLWPNSPKNERDCMELLFSELDESELTSKSSPFAFAVDAAQGSVVATGCCGIISKWTGGERR
ncbi:hypothetical protein ACOME3_000155 [Neoechinorhynchus agilis]